MDEKMQQIGGQPVVGGRQKLTDRLKAKYPDKNFDDDEALYGQIGEDYDTYDKEIEGYKGNEKKLTDLFASDPRSASFLMAWSKGGDPAVELVRQFGTDIAEVLNDPERQEEIAQANKEYVERVAKNKALEEEYRQNLAQSLKALDDYQQESGMTDDECDDVMQKVLTIVKDGLAGKFTVETIDMVRKALSHDADVAEAGVEGEVRGRNAKIQEKLRRPNAGDGTRPIGGSNNTAGRKQLPTQSLGALARFGDDGDDIWKRGGEKRTKLS